MGGGQSEDDDHQPVVEPALRLASFGPQLRLGDIQLRTRDRLINLSKLWSASSATAPPDRDHNAISRCVASRKYGRKRRVIAHMFRQPCNLRRQQLPLCGVGSNQDAFERTKSQWHRVAERADDQSPNSVPSL